LYNKIALLTREKFFYKDFNISDSFTNRIYLILFHLCFILVKSQNKDSNNKKERQDIFDFFFRQIELSCREIGYGDATVNKKMKALIKLFYEILLQCKNWKYLKNYDKNELLLSFFYNKNDDIILVNKLTNYFDKFSLYIEDMSLNSLTKGVFSFVNED